MWWCLVFFCHLDINHHLQAPQLFDKHTRIQCHLILDFHFYPSNDPLSKVWPRSSMPTLQSEALPTYQAVEGRVTLNHLQRPPKAYFPAQYHHRHIFQTRSRLLLLLQIQSHPTMMRLESSQSTSRKFMVLANLPSPKSYHYVPSSLGFFIMVAT